MNLLFLIPLVIALTASYIIKHTSEDISYLMGLLTFFTLLLSLVLAPWEIKLIIFIIVIIGVCRLWQYVITNKELETKPQILNQSQLSKDSKQLKNECKYRGIPYQNHHKTAEVVQEELKYRGIPCHGANYQQHLKP